MDARQRYKAALADPVVRDEMATLAFMTEIYCAAHHEGRLPYESEGVRAGIFEDAHHLPLLCEECAAHTRYGEARRALCPLDPKPSCKACAIHCYKPEEAAFERQVMRYAGPRALLRPHLIRPAWQHLRQTLAARKALREAR